MVDRKPQYLDEIYSWSLWLVALLAALVLTGLAYYGQYLPGDVTVARAIQSVQLPGLDAASDALYRGGLSPFFPALAVGVAAILFWRRHHLAATFVLLAAASRGMSLVLKEIVERPRPSAAVVDVSEQAGGFSFPSGHVLGTVLLLGFIFFLAQETIPNRRFRVGVQASTVVVIVLMGLQRVYTGAHWPTDVLAAYLWGGVLLFALVQVYRYCGRCHWQRLIARITDIPQR
jgi:membrane-associated phospholipid phosphatase